MSLAKMFDEKQLREIVSVKVDELAPSLGSVILAITEGVGEKRRWPFYKPSVFFRLTQLTDSFANIVRGVVEALKNRSSVGFFLNMDMGSGKTHLLTLLLHLFASCNINPIECSNYLHEYKSRTGYSEDLAQKTVVIAFDMRTPRLAYRYLKLTEKLLSLIGQYRAADLIKESVDREGFPDPRILAEEIDDSINILILVDELHYAATLASYDDREIVKSVVNFIRQVIDYRRTLCVQKSSVAVVVASARRDYMRWQEIKDVIEDSMLRAVIDSFVDQLQRIESRVESKWLQLSEAKRILEKRLGLRPGSFDKVFHKSFDSLIERVLKADSDIPQAHHMRALIKAFAIYALNALRIGDVMVTPAHFDDSVIDVLLGDSDVGISYKSIYSEITNRLKSSEKGNHLKLAVNSIFTLTITGAPEKLIEIVRIAKTKEVAPSYIPLVRETELHNILKVHGLGDDDMYYVIKCLDDVHDNIHRVRLANGEYAYFVAPVASVLAIYRRLINEKIKGYMCDSRLLVERLCKYVRDYLEYSDEYSEQVVIGSLHELRKKSHSRNKFYVYIYLNEDLLSQLTENGETRNESFNVMKKDAKEFFKERGNHNVVIVLPRITKDVLCGMAEYLAIDEATEHVINHYIAPLEKQESIGGKADEILRELTRLELKELKSEIGRRVNEALSTLTSAIRAFLVEAHYYTPKGVVEGKLRLESTSEELHVTDLLKVINSLRGHASKSIRCVGKELNERVRCGPICLITRADQAGNIIYSSVKSDLLQHHSAIIWLSEPMLYQIDDNRWAYIPSNIVKKAVEIVEGKIEKDFGEQYEIQKHVSETGKKVIFSLKPKSKPETEMHVSPPKPGVHVSVDAIATILAEEATAARDLKDEMEKLMQRGGGILWIALEVNSKSYEVIRQYLSRLKRYIKKWRVEAA